MAHGRAAHAALPGSRFVTLPRAAHFPHLEDPQGLAGAIEDFIATTQPATYDEADWQEILCNRRGSRPRPRAAA